MPNRGLLAANLGEVDSEPHPTYLSALFHKEDSVVGKLNYTDRYLRPPKCAFWGQPPLLPPGGFWVGGRPKKFVWPTFHRRWLRMVTSLGVLVEGI